MCAFYISKRDGILHYEDLGGYEVRNSSTFWCIENADKKYKWKDFDRIKISTGDVDTDTELLSYSKENYIKLVPDFNFHSWPSVGIMDYEQYTKEIDQAGRRPYEINKAGWIGNLRTGVNRPALYKMGKDHPELDIFEFSWTEYKDPFIRTPDLVRKYSMLIDVEGGGYSGRLKHLLWSHRPLLLVERPYKEYFLENLKEWVHYIPVKRDLSDLIEKTKWCIEHYDEALVIAENAFQFSKVYLTRDACYEKWNDIIQNFAHFI